MDWTAGVLFLTGLGFPFSLCPHIQNSCGADPFTQISASGPNYKDIGVKQSGCETNCSPLVSVEIKSAWFIPSPHIPRQDG